MGMGMEEPLIPRSNKKILRQEDGAFRLPECRLVEANDIVDQKTERNECFSLVVTRIYLRGTGMS